MSEPGKCSVIFRRSAGIVDRRAVRAFARRAQLEVAFGRPFDCVIADDRELRSLNRDFLSRDYPTDVLSFPSGTAAGPLGDLAISADRAREQAQRFGHGVTEEISILLLHGLLHLNGMDHERDSGRMRRAEANFRRKFGLPAGLIERSRS
jgi:probable rRNA maturation factor